MNHELPVKVTICQSILQKKNMDDALLALGEMGVTDIIPVRSERVFRLPNHGKEEVKRQWQLCAKHFVQNSLREIAPTVHDTMDFADAVKLIADYDVAILAYENEHDPLCTAKALAKCKDVKNIIVFIGPERGFEPNEVELAQTAGAHIVSLGKRIIRASNAGAILMGMLVYALELEGV